MSEVGQGADAISRLLAPSRRVRAARLEHESALRAAGIDPQWVEDHIRSLAQRFAEPILTRRRTSAGAAWPAVRDVYGADALTRDLAGAAAAVWNETYATFRALAARSVQGRRLRPGGPGKGDLDADEARAARRRIVRHGDPLLAGIAGLSRAAGEAEWLQRRARHEALWAECWNAMALELFALWADTLAPRLTRRTGWGGGAGRRLLLVATGITLALILAVLGWKLR